MNRRVRLADALRSIIGGLSTGVDTKSLQPTGSGVPYMIVSTLALSTMHALVRHTSHDLHPFEVAFFRNLFGLLVLIPMFAHAGMMQFRTRRFPRHLLRGVVGAGSMIAWFYGLSVVPLAEATALSYAGIVFATIGAVLFMNEIMGLGRWVAVGVCFAGLLTLLRPGFNQINAGMWIVLLSALGWGGGLLLVKDLARTDSSTCIVGWNVVFLCVVTMFPALWVWRWPSLVELSLLVLIGGLGTFGHLMAARALQLSNATVVLPLIFTSLLWAVVIGLIAFSEFPDGFDIAGSLLIVAGAAYLTRTSKPIDSHNKV